MRCGGSFCIFSAKAGAWERGSAGLLGAAFVRGGVGGAVAAGIQDRGKLLQLLEGADPQLFVDVLVVEAQGAVLDVQLLHDLPGAQPGHIAVKDAALGLCQVGDALQKGLEGIGDGFVAAHVRQPGKLCLHLLALHLQLVHPPPGLPPVLLKLPERRREDVLVEVHAAEHHKKEDEQADQQHLQVAGKDQPAVVRHGDADGQPVGLVLAQTAKLRDACIGAVGADQLGQAAAHAAQHQHVPGGMEVAAGGAAAEGGAGVQPAVCRGKQADQVVKAGGLGKVLLEKALADLKAAQPVHGAVAAILLVGGAAVAGLVGYGVYSYVSEQQLKALLPEGVAMPENRAQTALLLWNTAGRPEPAEAPAFKDGCRPGHRQGGAVVRGARPKTKDPNPSLSRNGSDLSCLVRVVIQNFSKTIVVQFVFKVIG